MVALVGVSVAPGLLGGPLAALGRDLLETARLGAALDARNAALARCREGKRDATIRVCRGELGLHEAARLFRALEAFDDGQDDLLPRRERPSPDHDAACRTVLCWADKYLLGDPRRAEVLRKLERELRAGPAR